MIQNISDIFSDIRKTLAISLGIHLLIVLLLMLFRIQFNITPPEYAEINFVSSSTTDSRTPTPAPKVTRETQPPRERPQTAQPERTEPNPATEQTAPQQPELTNNAAPVHLPKRRMLEEEPPELSTPKYNKITKDQSAGESALHTERTPSDRPGEELPKRVTGEKIVASPQDIDVDDKGIVPSADVGGPDNPQPFTIEGKASERDILHKVIPDYPAGLQKEAVIKIRFSVLPDGRVGQTIPVKKDYPELEDITIKALKQWRFNPLPESAAQNAVEGVITFRYKLL